MDSRLKTLAFHSHLLESALLVIPYWTSSLHLTALTGLKVPVCKAIAYIAEIRPQVLGYFFIKLSPIVRARQFCSFPSTKARRGRQRRAGPPSFSFAPLKFRSSPKRETSGHEPGCTSRDRSPPGYCLLFLFSTFFSVVWVSPCSFDPVPCRRCWLIAYPSGNRFSCFIHVLFHHFVSPKADGKLLLTCSSTWTA
jgi:hypothetical protein